MSIVFLSYIFNVIILLSYMKQQNIILLKGGIVIYRWWRFVKQLMMPLISKPWRRFNLRLFSFLNVVALVLMRESRLTGFWYVSDQDKAQNLVWLFPGIIWQEWFQRRSGSNAENEVLWTCYGRNCEEALIGYLARSLQQFLNVSSCSTVVQSIPLK